MLIPWILLLSLGAAAQEPGLAPLQEAWDAGLGLNWTLQPATASPPPGVPAAVGACAPGYRPPSPDRGKSGPSVWADAGLCLSRPIADLWRASQATEVMVWQSVTSLRAVTPVPAGVRVDYEARSHYIWCHTAQWSMEWRASVVAGTPQVPEAAVVEFRRVPGGNYDGNMIKTFSGRIELRASGPGRTSVAMHYEIDAPLQSPDKAADAAAAYLDRLQRKAAGQSLPGPQPNPRCP